MIMNLKNYFFIFIAVTCLLPGFARADFSEGNLFILNQPSSRSAGPDFILEFSPEGDYLNTLISTTLNIQGMRDLAFDPVSGHLFYTVNHWGDQIFEIREIDENGTLLNTYISSEFGSGNIELVFDQEGNLLIANDGFIYKKEAGSSDIIQLFELPYTGIGDLEQDSHGNLYLTDPFINDVVYKITPDGTATIFADSDDGIDNPYGLAMDKDNNLYVGNNIPSGPATIVKLDPFGTPTPFAGGISFQPGILDMVFDANGVLYASCRSDHEILKFDAGGNRVIFADNDDNISDPASMAFIIYPLSCPTDFDEDGDIDGSDLAEFAANFIEDCLEAFAGMFGQTN